MVPDEPPCRIVPAERQVRRFVPFFVASLALTLSLGATLGMISLARLTGTWGHLPRTWVWVHGYVQIFGFLALFVMGFAYHAVPRFVGAALRHPQLVPLTLGLQVAGVLCVAGGFLLPLATPVTLAMWSLGACALLAAATLFAIVLAATVRARASTPQPFEPWVVAGAFWLAAASAVALVAALRDDTSLHHMLWPAALYGFGGSWVFGIGRRLFPASLGWKPRWPGLDAPSFVLYQVGVAGWCAGAWPWGPWALPFRGLGAATLLAAVAVSTAVVGLVGPRRFRPSPRDRELLLYRRYVYAAWAWLFVGLLAGPAWSLASAVRGEYGSITMLDFSRHTVALGFVTQVIMAVGSRFIPVFTASRLWSPRAHEVAFWLLNAAVAIRGVEAALALGHWPEAWPLLALSGPPAVAALMIFAVNVLMAIRPGRPTASRSRAPLPLRVL